MAEDAGVELLADGLYAFRALSRLRTETWKNPEEVLDRRLEVPYPELIAMADALADRAEGAEKAELERLLDLLFTAFGDHLGGQKIVELLIDQLLAVGPAAAEEALGELVGIYRHRREQADEGSSVTDSGSTSMARGALPSSFATARPTGWIWSSITEDLPMKREPMGQDRPDPRRRVPSHPGALLREVVLPAMQVSISQAARDMKVSRQQLHKILAGDRAVTAEMAARLGKYCGNGPELWLNMQSAHDLWKARRSLSEELAEIPTRAAV